MTYILILYIYASLWSHSDSVTMTAVYGFKSQAECIEAGNASKPLASISTKNLRYVCLEQSK